MRVRRLKLSGFKSFVEPAELRIEDGLTGIVGPNGCGKSNVLEAIRWVMGESSPKSMRGAGMDDVIFAGTALRPARDFAEVSLLVERDQGDQSGDISVAPLGEVEITRRIERGAGSAYRVNGRDVRAKDVALLFADAATGAHSPALVSQGKISAVIAAKPTERRLMLEEAAGIAGLHVRRKDAEQKLRATEANLVRLDEILADMEMREGALRRQAKRRRALPQAHRPDPHRRGAADLRPLARGRRRRRGRDARGRGGRAGGRRAPPRRSAPPPLIRARPPPRVAEKRKAAEAAREAASALGHKLAALRAERDGVRRRIAELEERRRTLAADRLREEALGTDAAAAIRRLDEELAAIAARLEAAESGRLTIDVRTVEHEDEARAAETALGQARAVQAAEQAEARVAQAALDAARQKLARAEAEAARIAEQMSGLGGDSRLARDAAAGADEPRGGRSRGSNKPAPPSPPPKPTGKQPPPPATRRRARPPPPAPPCRRCNPNRRR